MVVRQLNRYGVIDLKADFKANWCVWSVKLNFKTRLTAVELNYLRRNASVPNEERETKTNEDEEIK